MPKDFPVWLVSCKRYPRGTDQAQLLKQHPIYTFHSSRYNIVRIILPLNAEIDMKKLSKADQNEWIKMSSFLSSFSNRSSALSYRKSGHRQTFAHRHSSLHHTLAKGLTIRPLISGGGLKHGSFADKPSQACFCCGKLLSLRWSSGKEMAATATETLRSLSIQAFHLRDCLENRDTEYLLKNSPNTAPVWQITIIPRWR